MYTEKDAQSLAFPRIFGIMEHCNNNQVTPFFSKMYEYSYKRDNINFKKILCLDENLGITFCYTQATLAQQKY